jgi:nuclease A inhibitor-like protein
MKRPAGEQPSSAELQKDLEKACEKLIYISETDSPVEPFLDSAIDEIIKDTVARALGRKPAEAVEEMELRAFFEKLTRTRDWHNDAQRRLMKRFADLEKLLVENLDDPKVFRFGTIRIDIFVVGRDADGNLAGVKTVAVET